MSEEEQVNKLEQFINILTDTLEAHAQAIRELYENEMRLKESLDNLSSRNEKLIEALLRHDTVDIQ